MNQSDETLTGRLRDAALDRADASGRRVDGYILDDDGVIDLEELDRCRGETSIASPAAVLATIRGRLGDAGEVSDLYAGPEPERSRWRIGLRARHAFAATAAEVDEVDEVEVEEAETEADVDRRVTAAPPSPTPPSPVAGAVKPISRLSMVPLFRSEPERDAEIDLRDGTRPIATCPRCMALGQRDLFDRFSQVEYYSCNACHHMWQQDRR